MPAASSMRAALVLPDDSFLAISFIVGPGDAPDRAATVRDRMPATRLALANAPDPEGTPAAGPSQGFPCSTSRPLTEVCAATWTDVDLTTADPSPPSRATPVPRPIAPSPEPPAESRNRDPRAPTHPPESPSALVPPAGCAHSIPDPSGA